MKPKLIIYFINRKYQSKQFVADLFLQQKMKESLSNEFSSCPSASHLCSLIIGWFFANFATQNSTRLNLSLALHQLSDLPREKKSLVTQGLY